MGGLSVRFVVEYVVGSEIVFVVGIVLVVVLVVI